MQWTVGEIARALGARLTGDRRVELDGVASIAAASGRKLVFADDERQLKAALESAAGALIAGVFAENARSLKPLVVSAHPRLAFARAAELMAEQEERKPGIHSRALVAASAVIGSQATIDACAIVDEQATIGEQTSVGAGSFIAKGVIIGAECRIFPNVTIYPGTVVGKRVRIHSGAVLGSDGFGYVRDPATGRHVKFPQIGSLEVGDDVEIGANSTIDRGALESTLIGRGTKIDNLVHVGHNCRIGENVIIAAQTGVSGSVVIEDNVIVGGQVGIADHARIEKGVLLGAQCGVLPHKIVRGEGVAFWGTPARPLRKYLKSLAALASLGRDGD
ncbi:MAG: UDP-3-O-(3-hydroxymyristoyl)glucosamine N-acyltransferase [Acidobacteria bacterium]|nr:UDP-3-O-(3-hydroxymyristoyl)glucosamine N-acyltransferase [Acidobacteriota bacterium]